MKPTLTLRTSLVLALILIAVVSRLLPHPYNFTPLAAISLFGAAHFTRKWQAFLIPLMATWLSDLFINNVIYDSPDFVWFYQGFYWQYGSYALIALLGIFSLAKVTPLRLIFTSFGAAIIFFLVSNFGVWIGSPIYPPTFSGLMACYAAGIPFFGGTLLGNLFYGVALFGLFHFLEPKLEGIKASVRSN